MVYIFIISTSTRDRHNTAVNMDGWKLDNYRANPIVMWSDPAPFSINNPDDNIGTSRVWIEDEKLYAEWKADPTSEIATKIEKKLKNGTSMGASVNFISLGGSFGKGDEAKGGRNETWHFKGQELLSWKITAVPSNPDCVFQKHYIPAKEFERKRKLRLMEIRYKAELKNGEFYN